MENTKKDFLILVVDDRQCDIIHYRLQEAGYRNVLLTSDLQEAEQVLKEHLNQIKIILLDTCIFSSSPNAMPFIALARSLSFRGKIVAMSGSISYLKYMDEAGADHSALKESIVEYLQQEGVL